MGMAAGQARLLSITSRMSDNELRAQLINNDKMRLATKSSQVSEAYVQALNDASLMFTNYDANNNASYQQLTFNALTAYNPYNNQYALSNASGKILVSEDDAYNFKIANGSLEKFLGEYNLTPNTTTYWESVATYRDLNTGDSWGTEDNPIKRVQYPTTETRPDGTTIYSDGYDPEQLSAMYEGGTFGNITYKSYEEIVSSPYYYSYQEKMTVFEEAYTKMMKNVSNRMAAVATTQFSDSISLSELKDKLIKMAEGEETDAIGKYSAKYTNEEGTECVIYKDYLDFMAKKAEEAANGYQTTERTGEVLEYDKPQAGYVKYNNYLAIPVGGGAVCKVNDDGSLGASIGINARLSTDGKLSLEYYYDSSTGTYSSSSTTLPKTTIDGIPSNAPANPSTITITEKTTITQAEADSIKKSIISEIKAGITQLWDPAKFVDSSVEGWKAFENAAAELGKSLGMNYTAATGTDPAKLPDFTGFDNYIKFFDLITYENDIIGALKDNATPKLSDLTDNKAKFECICNAQLLDNVMNTYGEPKYTWIDKSNPTDSYNENTTAKVQWYTNLFDRMSKGYTVLKDGLASSPEWIKFAFESGLVNMEQIDSYNNWNNLIYTNCSDITEQTNAAAVAKAEAEYNAAMNKIENKDKMYDLELKNIDTEHNSLQTEYDSIKSAIDKNIERTFKIYS